MLSIPHMIVIFVVVLVVFGPQKLPELARGLGKLMAEFRKASLDFKTAFEEEMRDLERQALLAERRKAAEAAAAQGAQPEPAAARASTETPSVETSEPRASEAPAVAPVAESVARGSADAAESNAEAEAANLPESSQDASHPA